MRVSAILCILLSASGAGAQDADVFSVNTSCAAQREAETRRHQAVAAEIAKERDDGNAVFLNERRACQSSPACQEAAERRNRAVMTKIRAREIDEEGVRRKNDIDIGANCTPPRARTNVPCPDAYLAEEVRYRRATAEIAKKRVDANTEYSQARNRCESHDEACLAATSPPYYAALQRIANEEQNEQARHQKAESDLQRCVPTADNRTPNDGGLPLPPDVRGQLLKGAAEMDRIATAAQNHALAGTNRFFKCLAEALAADMKFLAQPAYVPAAQLAKALHQGTWTYLTSNPYENNRKMFEAALQSLRQLRNDPACWFGRQAPGAAMEAATHLGSAILEAKAVQSAADAAVRTANRAAERRTMYGSSPGGGQGGRGINPHNPSCAPNMCFPSAIAKDLEWETGDPHWANAYAGNVEVRIVNDVPTRVHNVTNELTIETMLGSLYGNKKLKGQPLTAGRMEHQRAGKPFRMSSTAIAAELTAAGPGARGLVFLRGPDGRGHVINARNNGGKIEFPDASNSNMDGTYFLRSAKEVLFYRTN